MTKQVLCTGNPRQRTVSRRRRCPWVDRLDGNYALQPGITSPPNLANFSSLRGRSRSEIQTQRTSELPLGIILGADQPESVLAVDVQRRVSNAGMVQNVYRIQANLERLGFRQAKGFAHRRIETPLARQADRLTAICSPSSRPGVLKEDSPVLAFGDGLQCADVAQRRRHCGALRIGCLRKGSTREVAANQIPLGPGLPHCTSPSRN